MELRRYSFQRDVEERKEKDLRLAFIVNNIKMYYSDDDIMPFSQTTTFFSPSPSLFLSLSLVVHLLNCFRTISSSSSSSSLSISLLLLLLFLSEEKESGANQRENGRHQLGKKKHMFFTPKVFRRRVVKSIKKRVVATIREQLNA